MRRELDTAGIPTGASSADGRVPPPDPGTAGCAEEFVRRLHELRLWCGQPSLRTLRRLAGTTVVASGAMVDALPPSTTSYLLGGRGLPRLPRLEFVEAFVAACLLACGEAAPDRHRHVERWRDAWRALAAAAPETVRPAFSRPAFSPAG